MYGDRIVETAPSSIEQRRMERNIRRVETLITNALRMNCQKIKIKPHLVIEQCVEDKKTPQTLNVVEAHVQI
jgi:hypothetical protein